jgi:hypothetical protein
MIWNPIGNHACTHQHTASDYAHSQLVRTHLFNEGRRMPSFRVLLDRRLKGNEAAGRVAEAGTTDLRRLLLPMVSE